MRTATVVASAGALSACNAGVCAERRLIKRIKLIAIRKGVGLHGLSAWFHRVFGRIKVTRALADGTSACSMPCVCCAKALKQYKLKWEATLWSGQTCRNDDPRVPKPTPTRGMAKMMKWTVA